MPFNLDSPLSLYSIPAAWVVAIIPMNMKFRLIDKYIGYNNVQPRANTARLLDDPRVPKDVARKVERLEGAHLNGTEILPLWVAAVLAGNIAGISHRKLNIIAGSFIATRALYNYVYVKQSTIVASWFRTGVWLASISMPMYLLVKAGNILRNATIHQHF